MADLRFSHEEINDLARKVGTLDPFFSRKERALLLAIFAAAANLTVPESAAGVPDTGVLPGAETGTDELGAGAGEQPTLADLQQQLLKAYFPGQDPPTKGFSDKIVG